MTREAVYVIGHKNPDTDSICAALAYARLKNMTDGEREYRAVRCGNLNRQTRYVLERFGAEAPEFIKDVHPRVQDVMSREVASLHENDPVYGVIKNIDELKYQLTPVVSDDARFRGVISVLELSRFFASADLGTRPRYQFRSSNFEKTIRGRALQRGELDDFTASVMIGAMPFETFRERITRFDPAQTVLLVGNRPNIIRLALQKQFPALIITGIENESEAEFDLNEYRGTVYLSDLDTAETMRRLLLSIPARAFMKSDVPAVQKQDYLETARELLVRGDHKALPVLESGRLMGILTRTDLIKRVRRDLILVDHNELGQAVDGAEQARIVEIVDHHRLGTIKTATPIYFYARPVGSTCTLVRELYRACGARIDPETAGLLLSGILSDTVLLKSPTVSPDDREAAEDLAKIAGVDKERFGLELFAATESLSTRVASDIVNADLKIYEEFGTRVGIAQAEVVTLADIEQVQGALLVELDRLKASSSLNWGMLLITDIIVGESLLLTTEYEIGESRLAYKKTGDRQYRLPGVLSRKKQLLPEILRVLEANSG